MEVFTIPFEGLSGGIVVAGRKDMHHVDFYSNNSQTAFGVITVNGVQPWILGVIYASTCFRKRRKVWDMVGSCISIGQPVSLMGDFNVICSGQEKMGGKCYRETIERSEFKNFINSNDLIDLGFTGSQVHMV